MERKLYQDYRSPEVMEIVIKTDGSILSASTESMTYGNVYQDDLFD